ncbi:MAG: ATP-binding cassette domain-containing protein [Ignavibacteria bacterium]|jgi:ABC-type lipoprotein export system ATPase subunit
MESPLLECRNISKFFNKKGNITSVLNNVNLSVNEGETILIQGKSGAGKSVLLSLIAGLDKPTSGEIYFRNQLLHSLTHKELTKLRNEKIGIIFQNFNLISYLTAVENVEAALISSDIFYKESKEIAENILEQLELTDSLNNYPGEMSMGEQQLPVH